MCVQMLAPLFAAGAGTGAAATAAGATAAAAAGTGFNALQAIGLIVGLGGQLATISAQNAALDAQDAALAQQQETERNMNAVEDARTRLAMNAQLREQSSGLIARGIDLSSPTAVRLGVSAARELSFASQRVRSEGQARQIELSSQRDIIRTRRATNRVRGIVTVADTVLTAAPDIWPGLLN